MSLVWWHWLQHYAHVRTQDNIKKNSPRLLQAALAAVAVEHRLVNSQDENFKDPAVQALMSTIECRNDKKCHHVRIRVDTIGHCSFP